MNGTVDFGPQARLVARLVERVSDEQLDAATPCPEYAVRNLLGHLASLSTAFRDAARKDLGPNTDTAPGDFAPDAPPRWREVLPERLDQLAEAWSDPRAWEGDTRAGGVPLPGAIAGLVAMDELVVHGWDLARATRQEYTPDAESLEAAYAFLAPSADDPSRNGPFGPVVPVPDDAELLDRVIGLSGRDPRWLPG